MKTIITISGNVATGKSPIADIIKKRCNEAGKSCEINDNYLFSFFPEFKADYRNVFKEAAASDADVFVIVIGTGMNSGIPFKIEIQPGRPTVPMMLLRILYGFGK